ncbi:MAG TPA: hypothetical protein VFJ27_03075 [Terriglobia bacterium]|nr:hypothetical protein [Terriglobia bacterium]
MPVQKFRSVEEMPGSRRVEPGSLEHVQRVRAALRSAQLRATVLPQGVFKYPSIEAANADREAWARQHRNSGTRS